jgi:hypothetical protein
MDMDTPSKDIEDGELTEDLEATPEEAEQVKGGYDIYKYRKEHKKRHRHG